MATGARIGLTGPSNDGLMAFGLPLGTLGIALVVQGEFIAGGREKARNWLRFGLLLAGSVSALCVLAFLIWFTFIREVVG